MKPYRIPTASMEPTLAIGQRILVNRVGVSSHNLHMGEIVVFHPPAGDAQGCGEPSEGQNIVGRPGARACDVARADASPLTFVKRVVGLPGDRISMVHGHVIRNGKREHDPYIKRCRTAAICNLVGTIRIPSGECFMMGDNRGDSDDSRFWGPTVVPGSSARCSSPTDRIGFT